MILALKDENQKDVVGKTQVGYFNGVLVIKNNKVEKHIRLSNEQFSLGSYWLDYQNKLIMVELGEGNLSCFCIALNDNFEDLFPEASSGWGSYFFKLHYST